MAGLLFEQWQEHGRTLSNVFDEYGDCAAHQVVATEISFYIASENRPNLLQSLKNYKLPLGGTTIEHGDLLRLETVERLISTLTDSEPNAWRGLRSGLEGIEVEPYSEDREESIEYKHNWNDLGHQLGQIMSGYRVEAGLLVIAYALHLPVNRPINS